jgi:flagellar motor switch protein FliN
VAEDDASQLLSDDDIQALLAQAQDNAQAPEPNAPGADAAPTGPDVGDAEPLALSELTDSPGAGQAAPARIDLLKEVGLNVKIELGRTEMFVEDVLKLAEGSVVTLDRLAGDPVDILVNDRPVAKGEVLVLNDNFCVRIAEILPSAD